MCSCNNPKPVTSGIQSLFETPSPLPDSDGMQTQVVTFTSDLAGFFTVDSGNRYKSYGAGSKVTILSSDKPSLVAMNLIAP